MILVWKQNIICTIRETKTIGLNCVDALTVLTPSWHRCLRHINLCDYIFSITIDLLCNAALQILNVRSCRTVISHTIVRNQCDSGELVTGDSWRRHSVEIDRSRSGLLWQAGHCLNEVSMTLTPSPPLAQAAGEPQSRTAARHCAPGTRRVLDHEPVEEWVEAAVHEGQQVGDELQHVQTWRHVTVRLLCYWHVMLASQTSKLRNLKWRK